MTDLELHGTHFQGRDGWWWVWIDSWGWRPTQPGFAVPNGEDGGGTWPQFSAWEQIANVEGFAPAVNFANEDEVIEWILDRLLPAPF